MRFRYTMLMILAVVAFVIYQAFQYYQERALIAALPKSTNLWGSFTPQEGVPEATRIAKLWDRESFLQGVRIAFYGDPQNDQGISIDGKPIPPSGWMYRYFSASRGQFLTLFLTPDGGCTAESSSAVDYLDSRPLPAVFVDSPEAFRIAEESYGENFRNQTKLFRIYAQLTTWPSNVGGPTDPVRHRPNWQIHYLAIRKHGPTPPEPAAREDLYMMLDAVTGELLTVLKNRNTDVTVEFNAFAKH